jgi:regulator of replication initiation timing
LRKTSKAHSKETPEPVEISEDSSKQEELNSEDFSETQESSEKKDIELVSRTLLRLYNHLKKNQSLNEKEMIKDLELNTVNEKLRQQIETDKNELQGIYEENQALREMALQTQVEYTDQIDLLTRENNDLKDKLKKIDEKVKEELEKRAVKFQDTIRDLRNKLGEALKRNEIVTEVTEGMSQLQERIKTLFDQNEKLELENNQLRARITDLEERELTLKENFETAEKKLAELKKKDELQLMVIAGLKRQLGE